MRIISVRVGVCACMCIRLSQGEDETALRRCYEGVERDGEVIHVRDTVLLRSGPRKKSLPYVAKISSLWEDPKTGEEGGRGGRGGRSGVDTAVCAYACVDAGKGHMAEIFYLCVCVSQFASSGELMMSLFWYYRPEHTQGGRDPSAHCEVRRR